MVTVFRARALRRPIGRAGSVSTFSVARSSRPGSSPTPACSGDDRVVDFGAGTGVLTAALARRGASVLAIEIDPALAARLATRFAATPNVVVLHADVRDVPLPAHAVPRRGEPAVRPHRGDPAPAPRRSRPAAWSGPTSSCSGRSPATAPGSSDGAPLDLLGATWAPWWRFAGAAGSRPRCFNPRPAVDAAVLDDHPARPAAAPGRGVRAVRRLRAARVSRTRPERRSRRGASGSPRFRGRVRQLALAGAECQHGLALGYPEC